MPTLWYEVAKQKHRAYVRCFCYSEPMRNRLLNKTFFKFAIGFVIIVIVSLVVLAVSSRYAGADTGELLGDINSVDN